MTFIRVRFFANNLNYPPINSTHMKTDNANDAVAQGAAEWRAREQKEKELRLHREQERLHEEKEREERLTHKEVMDAVDRCFYHTSFKETIEEPYWPHCDVDIYDCRIEYPSAEILELLMQRGNHDEVMAMIKAYNEEPPRHSETTTYEGNTSPLYMPDYLQDFIARRGNREELEAFCGKHGFKASGQDILLGRGDHDELMWYLERHGFLLTQQRMLIARGNVDEIRQHIKHHGLAPELLDELLDELESGNTEYFYKFIALRELPVKSQERLLDIAKEPEFLAYIGRYGFWEQVLPQLAAKRSETELEAYIKKHHYLGKGVYDLARRGFRSLNMLYLEQPTCNDAMFIDALTQVPTPDYAALSKLYLRIPRPRHLSEKEEANLTLFSTGTHDEVMAFLKQMKPELCLYAEAALFFRNKQDEYKIYLIIKDFHKQKNQRNS